MSNFTVRNPTCQRGKNASMAGSIPFYLSAQLKSALQEARDLAAQKGLEQVFQIELFSLDRDVTEALINNDQVSATRAQGRIRDLHAKIKAAPDKNDGLMVR